jgi:hypothetical protein
MKKTHNIIWSLLALFFMMACEKDEKLVTYPQSTPVLDQAVVAEQSIVYGDSITLDVSISDEVTPLSTLEVHVVINNVVETSESIRTKDHQADVHRRYAIPFVPGRSDNASVKVYLSAINVDGYTRDSIINTTIAKRPVIDYVWLVPKTGTSYKLSLTDAEKYLYYSSGMNYGNSVSYWLSTKVDKFNKVDWSGIVFGKVGDGIGVITKGSDDNRITSTDETLVGISNVTFDAFNFTSQVGGKLLEPVTTLDINTDLQPATVGGKEMRTGNIFFGKDLEITFTGMGDLTKNLPPDYFEVTGANTAKFLRNNAIYKVYYYSDHQYLFVEPQWDVTYPEVLWMCGTGFGKPQAPYEATASWNWNTPFDYLPAVNVSPGVYQVTVYGKNTTGATRGTFDFKFFYQHTWGSLGVTEIDATKYTLTSPFIGEADGNVNAGLDPLEGVFRFTLNMNNKTITVDQIN